MVVKTERSQRIEAGIDTERSIKRLIKSVLLMSATLATLVNAQEKDVSFKDIYTLWSKFPKDTTSLGIEAVEKHLARSGITNEKQRYYKIIEELRRNYRFFNDVLASFPIESFDRFLLSKHVVFSNSTARLLEQFKILPFQSLFLGGVERNLLLLNPSKLHKLSRLERYATQAHETVHVLFNLKNFDRNPNYLATEYGQYKALDEGVADLVSGEFILFLLKEMGKDNQEVRKIFGEKDIVHYKHEAWTFALISELAGLDLTNNYLNGDSSELRSVISRVVQDSSRVNSLMSRCSTYDLLMFVKSKKKHIFELIKVVEENRMFNFSMDMGSLRILKQGVVLDRRLLGENRSIRLLTKSNLDVEISFISKEMINDPTGLCKDGTCILTVSSEKEVREQIERTIKDNTQKVRVIVFYYTGQPSEISNKLLEYVVEK